MTSRGSCRCSAATRPSLDPIEGDGAAGPFRTALPVERDRHAAAVVQARTVHVAAQHGKRLRLFDRCPEPFPIPFLHIHRHGDAQTTETRQPGRRSVAAPAVVPPAEGPRVERVVVHQDDEAFALLRGQPIELARRDRSAGMLQRDAACAEGERHPRKRHAVDGGERDAAAKLLAERRRDAERRVARRQSAGRSAGGASGAAAAGPRTAARGAGGRAARGDGRRSTPDRGCRG